MASIETRGRKPKVGARTNHITVLLSDQQLEFCKNGAAQKQLMGRGANAHKPSPARFIVELVENASAENST